MSELREKLKARISDEAQVLVTTYADGSTLTRALDADLSAKAADAALSVFADWLESEEAFQVSANAAETHAAWENNLAAGIGVDPFMSQRASLKALAQSLKGTD